MREGNLMRLKVCFISLCLSLFVSSAAFAEPIDYSFTYQGQLQNNGSPANGLHDFRVTPVDEFGVDLGPNVSLADITVVDGLFTLDIDFGDNPFSTEKVFLKIFVGQAGGESVELLPHTLIRSTPFAIQAQAASYADTANNAFTAFTSLDNEFTRINSDLHLGDTNERLLLNPTLSGGGFINPDTIFQVNSGTGFGGMYMNGADAASKPFYAFAHDGNIFSWMDARVNTNSMNFHFASEAETPLAIKPSGIETPTLVIKSTLPDGGKVVADYGNGEYHHAIPIAYGNFSALGERLSGTSNLSVVLYPAPDYIYNLNIDGFTQNGPEEFTVMITPLSVHPVFATSLHGAAGDPLGLILFDQNFDHTRSAFHVIIYHNEIVVVD